VKGIILAGGKGTRLYPLTIGVSKQLLPVYDKPMIYYPLSMLMLAGIREILVISTLDDLPLFRRLLGDGSQWGIKFSYAEQVQPRGLADAFIVGREFVGNDTVALILGDNIFYGTGLANIVYESAHLQHGAIIFAYSVRDPERYGIVEFDHDCKALTIEEKPKQPRSNFAVPGFYFYDNRVLDYAAHLKPSPRGEIEVTDLNRIYLESSELQVKVLSRGVAWLDAGTHESLLQAANYIESVENRQGLMISCPEEIAFRMGFISREQLYQQALMLASNDYGGYLLQLLDEKNY